MTGEQGGRYVEYLRFRDMGGAGTVRCADCGHAEEVTSFMHGCTESGMPCCDMGHQCDACGRLVSVHLLGDPPMTPVPSCECGGRLVRHRALYCPRCRSKNLLYEMEVIS